MSNPWLYALTVGPLGLYLWVLGLWHSYRHPKVVTGLVDFALLTFALSGVVVFGPFGQLLARALFGKPDLLDWTVIVSGLGLVACLFARRSLHRVVVYHVDAQSLFDAISASLDESGGRFARTLRGFEDREQGRGVNVELTPLLRSATVEAFGRDAEGLIQSIRPRLRRHLRATTVVPSPVALGLYGLSMAVMVLPLLGLFLTQPRARAAVRAVFDRLTGG